MNQRVVRREVHITCIQLLHNLILLAFIAQFQFLSIVNERSVRSIAEIEVHLVTHTGSHMQVHRLVEIEVRGLSVAFRNGWVVRKLIVESRLQSCTSARTDSHTTRTEYLLSRTKVEVHVREVELLFALMNEQRVVTHLEIVVQQLTRVPRGILLRRHQGRCAEEIITQFRTHLVHSALLVILTHIVLQVLRVNQVERRLHLRLIRRIVRLLHLHVGKCVHRHLLSGFFLAVGCKLYAISILGNQWVS